MKRCPYVNYACTGLDQVSDGNYSTGRRPSSRKKNKTFYQHLSIINMLLLVKNKSSSLIGCDDNKRGRKSGAIIF